MTDDRLEDTGASQDGGRQKRAPPTIDLEATEVSGATQSADAGSAEAMAAYAREVPRPSASRMSAIIVSALSGAAAAALVIGLVWLTGWPNDATAPANNTAQADRAAIDTLTARVANVESNAATASPLAADPAAAARIDALEKSMASLRNELAAARGQSEKLAAVVNDVKSAPREAAASPELSAIKERLSQIERTAKTLTAETTEHNAAPADDPQLRRVVAATLLEVSVRQGEPYAATLAAAKPMASDPGVLNPLETFAASGVPNANALCRELLTLVPKLSPVQEASTTGSGIVDRLQEGASRLVRIQRTDATAGDTNAAVVARVTAAALRNDVVGARHELKALAPASLAAAQPWIDKADARDAALAASHRFAADAMAALTTPVQ